MSDRRAMPGVRVGALEKESGVLALGCWAFGGAQWGGQDDNESRGAMEASLRCGMNHFDTAQGYGAGHSEDLVGEFLEGKRDQVFLATKGFPSELTAEGTVASIDASLSRLRTDMVDLFYIHWPRTGADLRPVMEGLENARAMGKIQLIGVSNFSNAQMDQMSEAGKINAHQLCYNLFWRFPERDVIPYCREHDIAVITYSSIAQGILTGKFGLHPKFKEGDQRPNTVHFGEEVWPHVYEGVEKLKTLSNECGRSLVHLAIRWVVQQPSVAAVLVGARRASQVEEDAAAMSGEIPAEVLNRLTDIADEVMQHIPDVGNIFRYYP